MDLPRVSRVKSSGTLPWASKQRAAIEFITGHLLGIIHIFKTDFVHSKVSSSTTNTAGDAVLGEIANVSPRHIEQICTDNCETALINDPFRPKNLSLAIII